MLARRPTPTSERFTGHPTPISPIRRSMASATAAGGRASARETIGRVAAWRRSSQAAPHLLRDTRIVAYVRQVHTVTANIDPESVTEESVSHQSAAADPDGSARNDRPHRGRVREEGDLRSAWSSA